MSQSNHNNTEGLSRLCEDGNKNLIEILGSELPINEDCDYFEISDLAKLDLPPCKTSALHLNIRSLPKKREQLHDLILKIKDSGHELDAILLCETFINDLNKSECLIEGYNLEEVHRSKRKQGGVAIFIKDGIKYRVRDDLTVFQEGLFESIFIEVIDNKDKNVIIGEIGYRAQMKNNFWKLMKTI